MSSLTLCLLQLSGPDSLQADTQLVAKLVISVNKTVRTKEAIKAVL